MPSLSHSSSSYNVECSGLGFGLIHALSAWLPQNGLSFRAMLPPPQDLPSEKLLMASIVLCRARYANVASGDPSLIIRCTVIRLLNTTVHVESRRRFCNARNTSATPASPECVATRICSMYLLRRLSQRSLGKGLLHKKRTSTLAGRPVKTPVSRCNRDTPKPMKLSPDSRTLILVAPFTDFSNELAIPNQRGREGAGDSRSMRPEAEPSLLLSRSAAKERGGGW